VGRVGNLIRVEQVEQIIRLTEQGKFRGDIARAVGVSRQTVYNYQKLFGLV